MTMTCSNKCDVCGKEVPSVMDSFTWGRPMGWMSIGNVQPGIGTETPMQYKSRQPDLCSWKCVTLYAAERAGLTVT